MGNGGTYSTGYTGNGQGDNMTVGDYANGVPNIRLSEIPGSFARQIPWMIPLILIGVVMCWYLTKDIQREYVADGSIWVTLGSEHVYDPAFGSKSNGMMITPDHVSLTEVAIIKNEGTLEKVATEMLADQVYGGERFAPRLYDQYSHASGQKQIDRWNDILKMVHKNYVVAPKAKSLVVELSYKHPDGEVAVETLKRLMATYQDFRKSKFVNETSGQVSERRESTQEQLALLEFKIQNILNKNGISEFTTEQEGVQKRAEALRADLNAVRSKISAAEAALAASEDQLRQVPENITLYTDDRLSQRLSQAKLERRQLLARYLPNSSRVRQKDAEIKELEAQAAANGGKATGGRRIGPNKVYQDILSQRNKFQAEADSVREQEVTIVAQLNRAVAKVRKMRELGPTYQSLLREKASLEERLLGLNAKEQEAIVNQKQQENPSENIKILSVPSKARKGRNMKKILFVFGSLGVMFSVFMLGLLRVFLDPRLYRARASSGVQPHAQARSYTNYQDPIPETMPEYQPSAPTPVYEPAYAAASTQAVPVYESATSAQSTGQVGSYENYENPYPTPDYGHEPQYFEQPSASLSQVTQPYEANIGGNGDVPVLGSTDTNPYFDPNTNQ